jgi:tetratricopeptide (TPR) repeat protein
VISSLPTSYSDMTGDGTICIVDFEMASRTGEEVSTKEIGGTRGFVAPERLSGWPADPRSDLYSLGRIIQAIERDTPELEPLLRQLCADSPGSRPGSAEVVLRDVADQAGPGIIPPPDLAFAGWRDQKFDPDRLASGVRAYLGCDPSAALKLARELQRLSDGNRRVAQKIWGQWLPDIVSDPWQPAESNKLQAALPRLRELAKIESRVRFLKTTPKAQKLAAWMAQLGESFRLSELEVVAETVGKPSKQRGQAIVFEQQSELIEELLRINVLRRFGTSEKAAVDRLRFVTAEMWEEAAKAMPPWQAQTVHGALAELLESDVKHADAPTPESLRRIASHWEAAGVASKASEAFFEAGEHAFGMGRSEFAADALGTGWRMLSREPRDVESKEIAPPSETVVRSMPKRISLHRLSLYANALYFCDKYEPADQWLDAMLLLDPKGSDLAEFHRCKAELCQRRRRTDELLSHVNEALSHAGGDLRLEGRLHFHRAQALIGDTNRIQEGMEAANKACELLGRARDDRYLSNAKAVLGVGYYHLGEIDLARSAMEEGLSISREAGFPFQEATAHTNLVAVASRMGRPDEIGQHLRSALALSEKHGYGHLEMHCITNLSHLAYLDQEWEDGIDYADRAISMAFALGNHAQALRVSALKAELQVAAGRIPAAERTCMQALQMGTADVPVIELLPLSIALLRSRIWFRNQTMETEFVRGLETAIAEYGNPHQKEEFRILAALDELLLGRVSAAETTLGAPPEEARHRPWHHLAAGRIAASKGCFEEAIRLAQSAQRSALEGQSDRFVQCMAMLEEALHRTSCPTSPAQETIERCIQLARLIKARWIEAQALLLLARCRKGGTVL